MAAAAEHDFRCADQPARRGAQASMPSSPMPTMDSQRGNAAVSRSAVSGSDMPRILVLGGTTEGRVLGERLAERDGLDVTLSLAGRTASPVKHAVAVRIGGFGGAAGLVDYLVEHRVEALIDATILTPRSFRKTPPLPRGKPK